MESKRQKEEQLLHAFLEMSAYIRGNRILSRFSFNEIMICNLLYRRQSVGEQAATATEIVAWTKLLKSQVNHILTGMEEKGLISRTRSENDKRIVYITLREDALPLYLQEHEYVLQIMDLIYETMGSEKMQTLIELVSQATTIVDEFQRRSLWQFES